MPFKQLGEYIYSLNLPGDRLLCRNHFI